MLADVAGVQPAVRVDRLGGLLGLVAVARHELGPRTRTSPSSASFDLDPGQRLARRFRSGPARVGAGDRSPLVSDMPQTSTSSARSRGRTRAPRAAVGAAPTLTIDRLVQADRARGPAQNISASSIRDASAISAGTGLPACSRTTSRAPRDGVFLPLRSAPAARRSWPRARLASFPRPAAPRRRNSAALREVRHATRAGTGQVVMVPPCSSGR